MLVHIASALVHNGTSVALSVQFVANGNLFTGTVKVFQILVKNGQTAVLDPGRILVRLLAAYSGKHSLEFLAKRNLRDGGVTYFGCA